MHIKKMNVLMIEIFVVSPVRIHNTRLSSDANANSNNNKSCEFIQ